MKSLNDLQVVGTIATSPRQLQTKPGTRGKSDLQILFPLAWTQDGVTNLITCSAISAPATSLLRHVQPGEPLLVTGGLDTREEGLRYRLRSVQRLVTLARTISVPGEFGPLLSLEGGESRLVLRGHVTGDSVAAGDRFRSVLEHIETKPARDGQKEKKITHLFPFYSALPTRRGQAVSLYGHFERHPEEDEHEGRIVADQLFIGESVEAPANLSIRDPRDRLQLDKLSELV